jgi:hypothetical protein
MVLLANASPVTAFVDFAQTVSSPAAGVTVDVGV